MLTDGGLVVTIGRLNAMMNWFVRVEDDSDKVEVPFATEADANKWAGEMRDLIASRQGSALDLPAKTVSVHEGEAEHYIYGNPTSLDGTFHGNPTQLDGTFHGNPGDGTLHDMLADVADHVDYEAAVVVAAADELEETAPEIANAAREQANAMEDAAEALEEAADEARDTAAEVFSETGIPQDEFHADEEQQEVIAGNVPNVNAPSFPVQTLQGNPSEPPFDSLSPEWADETLGSVDELGWYGRFDTPREGSDLFLGGWILEQDEQGFTDYVFYDTDTELNDAWDSMVGIYDRYYDTVEGNPTNPFKKERLKKRIRNLPSPRPGIQGKRRMTVRRRGRMPVTGNPQVFDNMNQVPIAGNPSPQAPISVNTPLPVPDSGHQLNVPVGPPAAPIPTTVDTPPEPSHWYTKTMFKGR